MKLLAQTLMLLLLFVNAFTQETPGIEVRSVEYIWERHYGDNRIVFAKDTIYQEILKRSFIKAIADRWSVQVPDFEVKVSKLSAMRMQPKFNPTVSNPDTLKWYIFLQFFDKPIPSSVQSYSAHSSKFEVRYRLIKGSYVQNQSASFNIIKTNPPPGQIRLERFSFHPSAFQYACDTIFNSILNDVAKNENEIWLEPACGFAETPVNPDMNTREFQFASNSQSISVTGESGFTIVQDSVSKVKTGKKKYVAENTTLGLLTLFSNVDTDKKRSALYTAKHHFSEGSDVYHSYVNYLDIKVAERRRVKDDDGLKSVEVGEYQEGWKEINPDVMHVITLNDDTVSTFNIQFRKKEEYFGKMWNGKDSSTVDSLSAAFNNPPRIEMEMKGNIDNDRFELLTSDEGRIKKLKLNGDEVFSFYSNSSPEGKLTFRKLNERQLKIATLLCLLSHKYYQYK